MPEFAIVEQLRPGQIDEERREVLVWQSRTQASAGALRLRNDPLDGLAPPPLTLDRVQDVSQIARTQTRLQKSDHGMAVGSVELRVTRVVRDGGVFRNHNRRAVCLAATAGQRVRGVRAGSANVPAR